MLTTSHAASYHITHSILSKPAEMGSIITPLFRGVKRGTGAWAECPRHHRGVGVGKQDF